MKLKVVASSTQSGRLPRGIQRHGREVPIRPRVGLVAVRMVGVLRGSRCRARTSCRAYLSTVKAVPSGEPFSFHVIASSRLLAAALGEYLKAAAEVGVFGGDVLEHAEICFAVLVRRSFGRPNMSLKANFLFTALLSAE